MKREETAQEANEYGCVDGVDENGDECGPSYDAEDSTCVDGVDENGDECEPSYDAEDSTCVDGLDEDGLDCWGLLIRFWTNIKVDYQPEQWLL